MLARAFLVLPFLLSLACASASGPVASGAPAGQPVEIAPKDARLAVDVTQAAYKPRLTPELNVPGNVVWGMYRVCATETGEVSDVGILTSATPEVDPDWVEKIRSWRYEPYLVDGKPVPFCYKLRLSVAAGS